MNEFAYQQPAQLDPFFNYDQALPFSPTAHQFDQLFSFPQGSQYNTTETIDPSMMYNTNGSYQHGQQHQSNMGGMTLPSFAPQSARWDAGFQPGMEGMNFDENLLGDFGAALMQAGDNGVW